MMIAAIAMIVLFQCYWISRIYAEEKGRMQKQADIIFKELVYQLQLNRFKADTMVYKFVGANNLFASDMVNSILVEKKAAASRKKPDSPGMRVKRMFRAMEHDTGIRSIRIVQINTESGTGKSSDLEIDSLRQVGKKLGSVLDPLSNQPLPKPVVKFVFNSGKSNPLLPDSLKRGMMRPPLPLNEVPMGKDSIPKGISTGSKISRAFIRMLNTTQPVADSLPVKQIDSGFTAGLRKAGIGLPFTIHTGFFDSTSLKDTAVSGVFKTSLASVGFLQPRWYQAVMASPDSLIMKKMIPQTLFSLLLVLFTSLAFVFLYRNIANQQKLALVKNEFISNVTHELKTPIATVQVAVEALKNFNAIDDPKRTKEYLDISTAELQRLNMLVDKVLKLSMFESGRIVLNKEWFNMKELVAETIESMRLQFDKAGVNVSQNMTGGNMAIYADKLHISSVVYNLLDNALKYSGNNGAVEVSLSIPLSNVIELQVKDNGIGIAPEFQQKIFEKFFRVPSGDIHNVKGYGLGLSYVSHIVEQHQGVIEVKSELGKGSTFILRFPVGEQSIS